MAERIFPSREGRWGVRQMDGDRNTGGGTINCGWATKEEAEAQNPPRGKFTFEAFERWSSVPACPETP